MAAASRGSCSPLGGTLVEAVKGMKCIKCEEEASAVCQFCGRAVCAKHIEQQRFVSGFTSVGGLWSFKDNALSVEDAVWCGICHPSFQRTS